MSRGDLLGLILALAAALILLVWYLSLLASRLDRLHRRVEGARLVLDNQLFQRSTAALELAGSGSMDPASAMVLAGAATDAMAAIRARQDAAVADPFARPLLADKDEDMELAESNLTQVMAVTVASLAPEAATAPGPLADLSGACHRVQMARKFHNEAVLAAQSVRRKRLVRIARVAGKAPRPLTVEFDDEIPSKLV